MKIECTPAELFELTGRVEIKAMMDLIGSLTRGLEDMRADIVTVTDTINAQTNTIDTSTSRLDHHDALLDIHEMRTGGQAIFYRDRKPT